jgi:ABC-2 type transport system permease protein
MGIFTDNPVLRRELRARLRLKVLQKNKSLAMGGGFALLIIAWFYVKGLVSITHSQPEDARELWSFLLLFLMLIIVVIAPALLSTAITKEREQQTWEALATTRLSAAQVLVGKGLGRISMAVLPILILLPFLLACAVTGGLHTATVLAAMLFLVVTAVGYGILGLLCSFLIRKSVSATVTALTVTLLICVGTPVAATLTTAYTEAASSDYSLQAPSITWLNPFYALQALNLAMEPSDQMAFGNGDSDSSPKNSAGTEVGVYWITTLLFAGGGLFYMIARYRRAARE